MNGSDSMRAYNTFRVSLSTQSVRDALKGSHHNGRMDHKQESARRLRKARIDAGFATIEALAEATDYAYSVSRLGNYEQGTRAMSPKVAADLAEILCCRAAWLLCLDDDNISPDERRLLTNYRMADDRGREVIHRIAETEADSHGRGHIAGRDALPPGGSASRVSS